MDKISNNIASGILDGNVPAGAQIKHRGDLIVRGNVADGAEIEVTDGGLKITGNVGNGVNLVQKGGSSSTVIITRGGNRTVQNFLKAASVRISGAANVTIINGRVYINGEEQRPDGHPACAESDRPDHGLSGVVIEGEAEDRLSINATGNVTLGAAGECLRIHAIGNVTTQADLCRESFIQTTGNVQCGNLQGRIQTTEVVTCGHVHGNVQAAGPVNCGDVHGQIKTVGTVRCGTVIGIIQTMGPVEHSGMNQGTVRTPAPVTGPAMDNPRRERPQKGPRGSDFAF